MPTRGCQAAAEGMTKSFIHRESDQNYRGVLAILNDRWRVIVCRDGVQWILQYRKSAEKTGTRSGWRGRSYCRISQALKRDMGYHAGDICPYALAVIQSLPGGLSL